VIAYVRTSRAVYIITPQGIYLHPFPHRLHVVLHLQVDDARALTSAHVAITPYHIYKRRHEPFIICDVISQTSHLLHPTVSYQHGNDYSIVKYRHRLAKAYKGVSLPCCTFCCASNNRFCSYAVNERYEPLTSPNSFATYSAKLRIIFILLDKTMVQYQHK